MKGGERTYISLVFKVQASNFNFLLFLGGDFQQCDRRRKLQQHGQSGHQVYDECRTNSSRVFEPFCQQFIGTLSRILARMNTFFLIGLYSITEEGKQPKLYLN